jgi:tetratricopeptide (TPR) repeat protein
MRVTVFGIVVVALAFTPPTLLAQAEKLGKDWVLPKRQSVRVTPDPEGKGKGASIYGPARVLAKKDGRVKLWTMDATGWTDKSEVLPVSKAIEYYTARLKAKPDSVHDLAERARVHLLHRDHKAALKDFGAALRHCRKEVRYFYQADLVRVYWLMKDYDRAMRVWRVMERDAPDDDDEAVASYRHVIAGLHELRYEYWKAKREYGKALAELKEACGNAESGGANWEQTSYYYFELAWFLATCPDARIRSKYRGHAKYNLRKMLSAANRDYRVSVMLMKDLDTLGGPPSRMRVYAAVEARDGNFDKAVAWEKKLLQDPHLPKAEVDAARARLKLYKSKKRYFEK